MFFNMVPLFSQQQNNAGNIAVQKESDANGVRHDADGGDKHYQGVVEIFVILNSWNCNCISSMIHVDLCTPNIVLFPCTLMLNLQLEDQDCCIGNLEHTSSGPDGFFS